MFLFLQSSDELSHTKKPPHSLLQTADVSCTTFKSILNLIGSVIRPTCKSTGASSQNNTFMDKSHGWKRMRGYLFSCRALWIVQILLLIFINGGIFLQKNTQSIWQKALIQDKTTHKLHKWSLRLLIRWSLKYTKKKAMNQYIGLMNHSKVLTSITKEGLIWPLLHKNKSNMTCNKMYFLHILFSLFTVFSCLCLRSNQHY